jgi:benzoyl-CoA 2,3-dioxygenase component A
VGASDILHQHLIDPEICIRCNTCEATCPIGAITHDDRNYVVDPDKCNLCMACVPPCPTGSIDNWRDVPRAHAYSLQDQLGWDELPEPSTEAPAGHTDGNHTPPPAPSGPGSVQAPWSAATPHTQLFGPGADKATVRAKVSGNLRVTDVGSDYDTHHIVLDFGEAHFPVLEGQSIGIVPPGTDANGRAHFPRQYSVASPRNGERPGYNNLSLTVKRVLQDHSGQPVRGVASNFVCDLQVGDEVDVVGPYGQSFLMPNHPGSHVVMICTGTGSAPMRAMTEYRRRLRAQGQDVGGKLLLFFGARTQRELPYFGPLQKLPGDFIESHFAFSREANQPKRYVQDLMREQAATLAPLLGHADAFFYVCGLKSMEQGVIDALRDIATDAGMDWTQLSAQLAQGRLHLETY